jgi:hypothetical protein
MGKLIVDQIQKPGGSVFTLPTTAAAGPLISDSSGNISVNTSPTTLLLPTDSWRIVGSITTQSARNNVYSTGEWSSSGPNSTYQNATAAGTSTAYTHQSWNMAMGDGVPNGTTEIAYNSDYIGHYPRRIEYAHQSRMGWNYRTNFYYDNATSYGGVTWRIMPVRNTTSSSITRTLNFNYSSQDTYNGSALGYYTPTTSSGTNYANVTGGTWTQPFTTTGSTSSTSTNASITIPANTTVLVMLISAHQYVTTYYFIDTSMFYNLNTFFPTSGDLVCDNRMLQTLSMYRDTSSTNNANSAPEQAYANCAILFGDR